MKLWFVAFVSLSTALAALSLAPCARAGPANEETVFKFSAPVELPGIVLPPGTYIFRTVERRAGDRDVVLVYGEDGHHLIRLFLTDPDFRLQPSNKTVIKFAETPTGAPQALLEWFYPGRTWGHEFLYPKSYGLKPAGSTVIASNRN